MPTNKNDDRSKTGPPKGVRYGGRSKGTPNKSTTKARESITKVTNDNAPRIAKWLREVHEQDGPKAALDMYIKLLEFSVPKLARQEIVGDGGGPVQSEHTLDASHLSDQALDELMKAKPVSDE